MVIPCQSGRHSGKTIFLMSLRWLLDLRPQGSVDSPPPHGLRPESGSSNQRCPRSCPYLKLTSRVVSLLPYMDPVSLASSAGRLPRPFPGHQVRTGALGQWVVRSHGQRDLGFLGTSPRCWMLWKKASSHLPPGSCFLPAPGPEPGTHSLRICPGSVLPSGKHLPSWKLPPATCRFMHNWGFVCSLSFLLFLLPLSLLIFSSFKSSQSQP